MKVREYLIRKIEYETIKIYTLFSEQHYKTTYSYEKAPDLKPIPQTQHSKVPPMTSA
jgi:hypothetical protein